MTQLIIEIYETYFEIYIGYLSDKEKWSVFHEIYDRYHRDLIEYDKVSIIVKTRISHGLLHDLLTEFDIKLQ